MQQFISPNFHAILVHFPLALLAVGVPIELFAFLWPRSSFRQSGRWMIFLGALAALPAATSGIYALHQDIAQGDTPDTSWADVRVEHAAQWHAAKDHALYTSLGTALMLAAVVTWVGASDGWRARLYWPTMVLVLWALAMMTVGARHGGGMVYEHGFGQTAPTAQAAPDGTSSGEARLLYLLPQPETHIVLSGILFAVAIGAMAVSIRRASTIETQREIIVLEDAKNIQPISILGTLDDKLPVRLFPARFWFLALFIGAAVIYSGLYTGGYITWPKMGAVHWDPIKGAVHDVTHSEARREGMHILFGTAIVGLILALTILTRVTARSRFVLGALTTILVLVIGGQIWLGILLLYDGPSGPVRSFNPPTPPESATTTNVLVTAPQTVQTEPATQP